MSEEVSSEEINVVNALAMNYGASLVRLNLECFVSSANLIMIANRCPYLVDLTISFTKVGEKLTLSAIKAVASLSRLNRLTIGNDGGNFSIDDGALPALARFFELNFLSFIRPIKLVYLKRIFRGVGRNLVSLALRNVRVEAIDAIETHCPKLQTCNTLR
jgi:hypothetical protein